MRRRKQCAVTFVIYNHIHAIYMPAKIERERREGGEGFFTVKVYRKVFLMKRQSNAPVWLLCDVGMILKTF